MTAGQKKTDKIWAACIATPNKELNPLLISRNKIKVMAFAKSYSVLASRTVFVKRYGENDEQPAEEDYKIRYKRQTRY